MIYYFWIIYTFEEGIVFNVIFNYKLIYWYLIEGVIIFLGIFSCF